ncbi:MAG TPA: sigma-70 family RNA polymerase sigma factor [Pyrinomonadaceae bacterium]|jgi:RNA polymerase sigma factor (TIGR02999 family)|nr:sigma-70 family RNA polymerase sigma factor [Pyrinomonadaceae bacterium]
MDQPSHDVTRLLHDWSEGDEGAAERLMPLVYDELRRLARDYLRRERPDHTLQPTALVNEAYMKLVDQRRVGWQNRHHFYGIAAQMMRRVLVDHARSHAAEKRGGRRRKVSLDEVNLTTGESAAELVALDEALQRLSEVFPRKGRVVELRFFGGLGIEETARVLGVSDKTVMREWESAKLWLYRELDSEGGGPGEEN